MLGCVALLGACGGDDASGSGDDGASTSSASGTSGVDTSADGASSSGAATTTASGTSTASSGDESSEETGSPIDCDDATEYREQVVCAAEALLATLSDDQRAVVQLEWTDAVAKTRWSNLPGVDRSGISLGDLSDESRAAALVVAQTALSAEGYEDYTGILAADDYLAEQGGGPGGPGGPGGGYSSDNSIIAFIGTPSVTDDWMLQLGNHHMAFNLTYVSDGIAPTPNHEGTEPKGEFMVDGVAYAPLDDDAEAFFAVFEALDAGTLDDAYLTGQMFADVLLGPVEYESGSYGAVDFPSGANRMGVLVSTLSAEQQALVTAAIEAWVGDYPPAVADALRDAYTSAEAYADTYVAWAGSSGSGPDPDVSGTYLRIDGPRAWIELACQGGVVIAGQTHYHTIYRDKTRDYGASL